jgi:UDPglucose 6-dehydrogenase
MQIDNIAIVGQGFVGTAVREGMRHAFQIYTYDIKHPDDVIVYPNGVVIPANDRIGDLVRMTTGPIFICVPTPMKEDGSCDISIVESTVKEINDCTDGLRVIAIKSTVAPGTTEYLKKTYSNVLVCFNPEFLTERNAIEDFKNQDRIILGGPHEGTAILKQVYQQAYPGVPVTKTSSTIAELVKYLTNAFLSTKVAFANEIKQICDALEADFDKVIEYATKDKRLGTSHWAVPGPDGHKGFGGKCFCKDLNALISLGKQLNVETAVLKATWEKNLSVRPEKDWEEIIGVISK